MADVESSKKYYIEAEKLDIPNEGAFIELPQEFVDNFIMGLLDFSCVRGNCVLDYNWDFGTKDGVFGVQVAEAIPYHTLTYQFSL